MLDLGSGTGVYSFYFSRSRDVHVCGVDICKVRVAECQAMSPKLDRASLDFITSSRIFETNRFYPDSIDVVLAIEVLPYLFDIPEGFREIQQVLHPGGYLIGHVPFQGYCQSPETVRFDRDTLARLTKESGLDPISITRVFGGSARFLSWVYAYCARTRLCTAIAFPFLLMASLTCGGKNSKGSYCLFIARKPLHNGDGDPSSNSAHRSPNLKP
jgi:ubiquinone/menaquinone biosynthesis C-methylase UbiE